VKGRLVHATEEKELRKFQAKWKKVKSRLCSVFLRHQTEHEQTPGKVKEGVQR
jgi:hypothetical protein